MTIVHLISSSGYYGAENMLLTLAQWLQRLGHRCVIAVFRDARQPRVEIAEQAALQGIAVEAVPCDGRFDRKAVRRIADIVDRHAAGVLHTHGYKADVYGYMAARLHHRPLVSTCHNWADPGRLMRLYAAVDRMVLKKFDCVVAVSEQVGDVLRSSGGAGVRYICNGVDPERWRAARPRPLPQAVGERHCSTVGFVGRLVPEKGGDILIQAAASVLKVHPRTVFLFVGEGPAQGSWQHLAHRLGIGENVLFPGVSHDMRTIYSSLDVMALPSRREATPMCLLEAMAAGTPAIACRVGGVPKIIVPGVTGLMVEPNDSNGLSAAILDLLDNPARAEAMADRAQARIAERFSAQAMARSYAALYDNILGGGYPIPISGMTQRSSAKNANFGDRRLP